MFWRLLGIENADAPGHRVTVRCAIVIAMVAILARALFWGYTGSTYEDALITALHTENCLTGHGLTHHPSEPRVQGYTSPLAMLVLLAGNALHWGAGLPIFKVLSMVFSAIAVSYVLAIAVHPKVNLPAPAACLPMVFGALEYRQIAFGMSGMESQLAATFLLMSAYFLLAEKPAWLGASLGLCMLTRPDFAFWVVIVASIALCHMPRRFPVILTTAGVVYGPWLAFATAYYGSPLPNTIVAKSMGYPLWWRLPGLTYSGALHFIWSRTASDLFDLRGAWRGHAFWLSCARMLAMPYNGIAVFMLVGTGAALFLRRWALLPGMLFVAVYWVYYVFCVGLVTEWYIVPFLSMAALLAGCGLACIPRRFQAAITVLYTCVLLALLPPRYETARQVQVYVDDGVRRAAGEYLNRVMKPEETLGCEPLGYVGYYARRTVYDWPGLGSKAVTGFYRAHPDQRSSAAMFAHFRPSYLLLRPWEYQSLEREPGAWISREYHVERVFEVSPDAPQAMRERFDAKFVLLKKNAPQP